MMWKLHHYFCHYIGLQFICLCVHTECLNDAIDCKIKTTLSHLVQWLSAVWSVVPYLDPGYSSDFFHHILSHILKSFSHKRKWRLKNVSRLFVQMQAYRSPHRWTWRCTFRRRPLISTFSQRMAVCPPSAVPSHCTRCSCGEKKD